MVHAKELNETCLCRTLDFNSLSNELKKHFDVESLLNRSPHLFSQYLTFISLENFEKIKNLIFEIEKTVRDNDFLKLVMTEAPIIAQSDFGLNGLFMGYDFHLSESGPKLIEINTNAGGAYLNYVLAGAHSSCCEGMKYPVEMGAIEDSFYQSFLSEWKLQRGELPLNTIAILDENPKEQFLYPEFKLFNDLLTSRGHTCFILDPMDLQYGDKALSYEGNKIDLIYNRSTDFYFMSKEYDALKKAYLLGDVVVSPSPRHHAVYANKRNLTYLTNERSTPELLAGIPHTVVVTKENSNHLWDERKNYFFKPMSGYGSKAAYRGDKITKRVWEEILSHDYVAQKIVKPGVRVIEVEGKRVEMKQDLRVYTYDGKILILASRLYNGQTTNFKTDGGGFAPVFLI
ncbi:MAG: hypothetical protein K2P81_16095 [Bacteriovoracaceae bacterium]|nr:hypothetical protein [Bacteriovoracaceae bacterium]